MKRKFVIATIVFLGAMVVAAIGYGVAVWGLATDPVGKYADMGPFNDSPDDRLEFRNGKVMWRTPRGDSPHGTYKCEADGRWIWTYTEKEWIGTPRWQVPAVGKYDFVTKNFVLRRTLLHLQIEDLDDPSDVSIMRRRFFTGFPF